MPSYCIHMCMWGAACTDGHICVRDDLDCCLDCSPGWRWRARPHGPAQAQLGPWVVEGWSRCWIGINGSSSSSSSSSSSWSSSSSSPSPSPWRSYNCHWAGLIHQAETLAIQLPRSPCYLLILVSSDGSPPHRIRNIGRPRFNFIYI